LVQEGFEVTGLEPIGTGFSHFERMRQIILARATTLGCLPQIINLTAEAITEKNSFEYAFSINVMEHVNDVERVLANVADSLKVGAIYRFTCPNYAFPYEPHFDIFTIFSKRLTEKLRHQKIFGSNKMLDPSGTWASLNWINVVQVRNFAKRLPGIKVSFNTNILVSTLDRLTFDKSFASRRSWMMRGVLVMLVRLRLHALFRFVPAMFQPIMDCTIEKVLDMESVK
jgi:SAM-dependent methyltransferase